MPQLLPALRRAFDSELDHGNAFLFAPVFLALGALLYFSAVEEPGFFPLALAGLALAGLAAASRARLTPNPVISMAVLAAAMTLAGMLAAKVETWRAATPMLGAEISTRLTGRVVRVEQQASGRVRLTLDVVATERPRLRYAPERVRLTARAVPGGLRPGEVVTGAARLMPPSGPVRPQSYDFSFRSYFDGIGAIGFFLSGPERAAGDWPPPSIGARADAVIEGWRQRMASRIEASVGGAEGAIAAALITGVRAGIPDEINEALRVTGLYHVISISGLHMALVAGTLMVALRCGFALAPSFSMRRPVKKYAAAVALAATAFYLVMSGGDVAARRAFLMLAVMLAAVIFDRAALTMRNLAISAIVILLVAPHEVVGPSFQMSFAATAALVAAYAAWTRRRERRQAAPPPRRSLPAGALRTAARYAVGLSMTSVIAGLATALFTAWHFQQVSPMGLFANLAAMPVVSVVVMPMAVLAALAMPFGLDAMPLWLMGQGIAAMNAIAMRLAALSAFDATGAIPLSAVLAMAAALAILTMAGSGLRWTAAPLVVAGLALLFFDRAVPDLLVSEDGRLVAMRLSDGRIAVNRARPQAFTMQNWSRALGADDIVGPRKAVGADRSAGPASPGPKRANAEQPAKTRTNETVPAETPAAATLAGNLRTGGEQAQDSAFLCEDGVCVARHASGATIVHAPNAAAAAWACTEAVLIVIDDATARNPCPARGALVMTGRDLARYGSAEIFLQSNGRQPRATIRHAITEPYRPWHDHRRFSRAARGLAPWRPQPPAGETPT